MKKVLGIGNALTDILFKLENDKILDDLNLPKGSMQLIDNKKSEEIRSYFQSQASTMATGGSASNTINGITKLGTKGGFIGKIGNDDIGVFFSSHSKHNGVETFHITSDTTASGNCTILVSADSERTLCTFLGAASELLAEDLDPTIFSEYDIFHVEGYLVQNHDLIRAALSMAKETGLLVSIDLASFNVVEENRAFLREMIEKYVDIVFANEEEARAFSQTEPEKALHDIATLCDIAVVKLGKGGSLIKKDGKMYTVKAIEANSIDTTGAGDMYAAGFLHGLANDYSLEVCGKIGALVSGKVVEVIGAKLPDSTWEDIYKQVENIVNQY